jgi:hypothetical protein
MDAVTEWWNGLDDLSRVVTRDVGIGGAALIAALLLGFLVRRFLVSRGLDTYLRFPWAPTETTVTSDTRTDRIQPAKPTADVSTLTRVMSWFASLSICAGALWRIMNLHEAPEAAESIRIILIHSWELALVVFPILLISGWLSHTLYDLLRTPWVESEMNALFPGRSQTGGSFAETIAKALCVVIYAAFFLMIPVAIAALFNIAALEGLVVPAWHVCARLLTALIVFALGYLGVAWARSHAEQIGSDGTNNEELGHQVSLVLVIFTIILAMGLLVGISGFAGGLVVVVLLAFLLWPIRTYIRDLCAGFLLRVQKVKQVKIDGVTADVTVVSPLITHMEHLGTESTSRNWDVLTAAMDRSTETETNDSIDDAMES